MKMLLQERERQKDAGYILSFAKDVNTTTMQTPSTILDNCILYGCRKDHIPEYEYPGHLSTGRIRYNINDTLNVTEIYKTFMLAFEEDDTWANGSYIVEADKDSLRIWVTRSEATSIQNEVLRRWELQGQYYDHLGSKPRRRVGEDTFTPAVKLAHQNIIKNYFMSVTEKQLTRQRSYCNW